MFDKVLWSTCVLNQVFLDSDRRQLQATQVMDIQYTLKKHDMKLTQFALNQKWNMFTSNM
jgi:hypothetical protein